MEKKLTLSEIKRIAEEKNYWSMKAMKVTIPESAMKYDRIRMSQERTKRLLEECEGTFTISITISSRID